VVGQFALKYLNNKSLHAGYRNYVLHKTTITNKMNHAETRISVENASSQYFVQGFHMKHRSA